VKVVLVTGASRGIGAATALLAARSGYAVGVNYVERGERAQRIVEQIRAAGGTAVALQADTSDEAQVVGMFERVERELGPLTALVNNAGIVGRPGRLEDCDADGLRRLFDVNVIGLMLCARAAIARLSTARGGRGGSIVNISSIAATLGGANRWLAYAASKGAVNTLTIGLAQEVGGEGIRVNAVSPGLIDTDIRAAAGVDPRVDAAIVAQVPLGRIGTPQECAEAIVWLLSEAAAYISGAILPLTGGR